MSKSKTNFNTFLKECEEYESVGTNENHRQRHHQHTTNNGSNIFLNSNSNLNSNYNANANEALVDSSKLVLNDDNFPSLSSASSVSSSKPKPEIQNNKINFKNALSSSSPLLLQQQQQQQQQQQKRMAAISAASTCSNVSHALVKKESEYIAKKIILSKKIKGKSNDYDDYDDDDDDNDDDVDEYE